MMKRIVLRELIDLDAFQKLMDEFYSLTGIPIGILDMDNNILVATGWQRICTHFHRKNPETLKNCLESDQYLAQNLSENKYVAYKCKNNLWDIGQPVFVEGQCVAQVMLGQFRYSDEEFDDALFAKQADKYKFDKQEYLDALHSIPEFTRENVDKIMKYYLQLAKIIAYTGYTNYNLRLELEEKQKIHDKLLTSQKESEKERIKYKTLADNIPNIIARVGRDLKHTYVNAEIEKYFDYPITKYYGKTHEEIEVFAEYAEGWKAILKKVFEDGEIISYDFTLKCKLGIRQFEAQMVPEMDSFGAVESVMAILHDITERKNIEEELKTQNAEYEALNEALTNTNIELSIAKSKTEESEAKFRKMFYVSPDSININRFDGTFVEINKGFTEFTGYTEDELESKTLKDINIWSNRKELFQVFQKLTESGVVENMEAEFQLKNGQKKIGLVSAAVMSFNYEDHVICIIRDISEMRNVESKLYYASTRAEENERERYAKELHDGLGPILSTCLIYLNSIIKKEDKLSINEYAKLAIGFIEEGLGTIKEISNNLSPTILKKYGVVQAVRSFIEKVGFVSDVNFKITSNYEERMADVIEITVYRVLIELINNSLKYSRSKEISISFEKYKNKYLYIYFNDDGDGFNYKEVKKEGKGFGLTNLENRILKIGGKYEYRSKVGDGVQVEIRLKNIFLPEE